MNIFEQYAHSDLLRLRESESVAVLGAFEKHLDRLNDIIDRLNDIIERMQRQGEEYCSMCRELYYKLNDIVLDEYEMSPQELENIERVLMDIEVF